MEIVKRLLRILSFIACFILLYVLFPFIMIQWLFAGKYSMYRYGYRFFYYAMEGEWPND